MWKPCERRPALHPGEGRPVDEKILQARLEADGGVAYGGFEEDEAIAVSKDGRLCAKISRREAGAVDAEVGDERRAREAERGLDLVTGPGEVFGCGRVCAVGDVGFEVK